MTGICTTVWFLQMLEDVNIGSSVPSESAEKTQSVPDVQGPPLSRSGHPEDQGQSKEDLQCIEKFEHQVLCFKSALEKEFAECHSSMEGMRRLVSMLCVYLLLAFTTPGMVCIVAVVNRC